LRVVFNCFNYVVTEYRGLRKQVTSSLYLLPVFRYKISNFCKS